MPIAEDKALDILSELIRKPDSKAEDVPRIWGEILAAYNSTFAPVLEEPKKKKRRKRVAGVLSPNLGWPQGVSRAEYSGWKETQLAKGVTEGLNPQEYKRLKDAGVLFAEPEAAEALPKGPAGAKEKTLSPAPKPSSKKKK
jgi:hypothetical protein